MTFYADVSYATLVQRIEELTSTLASSVLSLQNVGGGGSGGGCGLEFKKSKLWNYTLLSDRDCQVDEHGTVQVRGFGFAFPYQHVEFDFNVALRLPASTFRPRTDVRYAHFQCLGSSLLVAGLDAETLEPEPEAKHRKRIPLAQAVQTLNVNVIMETETETKSDALRILKLWKACVQDGHHTSSFILKSMLAAVSTELRLGTAS